LEWQSVGRNQEEKRIVANWYHINEVLEGIFVETIAR